MWHACRELCHKFRRAFEIKFRYGRSFGQIFRISILGSTDYNRGRILFSA